MSYPQIIDANINRVCEGLRVIEEYMRFIRQDATLTNQLSTIRKQVAKSEPNPINNLMIRDTQKDTRAKEKPAQRTNQHDRLKANFKRVEEALRVLEEYTSDSLYNQLRYDMYELEKDIILNHLKPLINPGIYLISDKVSVLKKGLKMGVSLIQLRDKAATKEQIYNKSKELVEIARKASVPFILNDYSDIALHLDCDGLHTGQDDISVEVLRDLFGEHKILGRTTHSLEQGLKAQQQGADYVSVGPVWETPSKPGRDGIGLSYLRQAGTKLSVPYVAIGGINLDNLDEIMAEKPPLIGFIRAEKDLVKIKKKIDFLIQSMI